MNKKHYNILLILTTVLLLLVFPFNTLADNEQVGENTSFSDEAETTADITDEKEQLEEPLDKHIDFWLVPCSAQIKVAWEHSDSIDYYRVYLSEGDGYINYDDVDGEYVIIDGLEHNTKYSIYIEAVSSDENGEQIIYVSDKQSVKTK